MSKVPVGYKQTEVGVIPEDWEVSSVGDEFSIQLGKMLDAEKNAGVPKLYLGNRAVQWGRIDHSDIGVIKLTPSDLQRYRLRVGDLLVCEGGEIGRAAIWNQPIDECYYQKALHRLRPLSGYNVKLMQNILQRFAESGFLLNFVTQTSIAHLPKDKFEKVPIPLPPTKAEQEAIAEALSDTDALIESLEKLIAKKRHLKQGAMQELLTGQKRLPGFSGEWEDVTAAEIGKFKGGCGFPLQYQGSSEGAYPFYKVSDMNNEGNEIFMFDSNHWISEETLKALGATLFPANSIVFAKVGAAIFLERKKILSQASCIDNNMTAFVLDANRADCKFVHYLLLNIKLGALVSTTALPSLNGKQLAEISITLPSIPEQTAIATILSDMDAEIAALESKLAKTRRLKQGMMHNLLTGRIRLL